MLIRPARLDDGNSLQGIELAAGARFRDVGFADVADHDPTSVDELARYATAGRSWVATHTGDIPVGYVVVDVVDGNAHIEQVSVDPADQGTGIGRALMEHVRVWAASQGHPGITLTTFRDVEWNRPLYEHLGYTIMTDDAIGSELRALRAEEAEHGLDPAVRVCMYLPSDQS